MPIITCSDESPRMVVSPVVFAFVDVSYGTRSSNTADNPLPLLCNLQIRLDTLFRVQQSHCDASFFSHFCISSLSIFSNQIRHQSLFIHDVLICTCERDLSCARAVPFCLHGPNGWLLAFGDSSKQRLGGGVGAGHAASQRHHICARTRTIVAIDV